MLETKWDFAYDGDGVRTATLTTPYDETGNPQSATLTVYYFGGAYELNGAGAFDNNNKLIFTVTPTDVKKYYSFGGQTVMRDADGLQYFLTDHLGSTVATTDNDGTLTSQQRYLPFGGIRTDLPTPEYRISNTDLGYTGQRLLDSGMGGLMDYKARFYSPLLGRFTQPDSIIPDVQNPQSFSRYTYVKNNPILYNDSTGHCWGIASGLRGVPGYDVMCSNLDQAWSIAMNPDATYGQKSLAWGYMGAVGVGHTYLVVGVVIIAGHTISEAISESNNSPRNDKGDPYPRVTDPKTGKPVKFPEDPKWLPKEEREPRPSTYRDDFMKEWQKRGYPEPEDGWKEREIHHENPLEYGGDNSFENGTPLKTDDHLKFTKWWRGGFNKRR